MWFIPTGFEDRLLYKGSEKTTAEVLSVDDHNIDTNGLLKVGEQSAQVRIRGGKFKGREVYAFHHLTGSLSRDTIFKPGDRARVVIDYTGDDIRAVNLIDIDRFPQELFLTGLFAVLLVVVAGKTGFRALLSFILSVLMLWKILVPCILDGKNPIVLGMVVTTILTILIEASVFGVSWRSLSAIGGSMLGILATFFLSLWSTTSFQINGAVMARSETLIYSGFPKLNLTQVFMATVFIGASGAIMDLGVDITAATAEVVAKKPTIGWYEAFRSALNVGRAALGTMTTTLLFAYSGGYLVLMMVFMAQGTPLLNILNYKPVAAEILHTLVGSLGLVTVAPFTAFLASVLLTSPKGNAEIRSLEASELIR